MKILIASSPFTGHINPMFSIGRMLVSQGHEVAGLSASAMRSAIEGAGATFYPFPDAIDRDYRDMAAVFPDYKDIPPGLEMSRFYLERVFIDPIPAQDEGLKRVLSEFSADVILADNLFFGAFPMLLGSSLDRPPIILCGTMFLHFRRDDGAPNFAGLLPAQNEVEREAYAVIAKDHEEVLYLPVRKHLNNCLWRMGIKPLAMDAHEAAVVLPDAYLQLTVPDFEFPRRDLPRSISFVGALPIIPRQAPLPPWARDLDGSRKVVLVTQGTVSNHNFDQLIIPTLAALANEPDVLVVATTGGRPIEAIASAIPSNARIATYLPFEWLLPHVDALVTNGGYGSVNQALSFGIPLVAAGLTEDKADTNARVAWSGVGIDLKTQEPTSSALREAIRAVLDMRSYRARSARMAAEFAKMDTRSEILSILDDVVRDAAQRRGRARAI
ncbi:MULTISPECIES: glycosyltransferase [Bradyrhizobium]|uniref:UDP-glucosyltransferase n=1 Tax=Bradyrhizobium canariense TaxID=255045 RepID=A0A1X3FYE5_9BRAD|nr:MULTISPECIES: nucleotide disphospho-sugar-binding domain-containing protein [Bradyrhizobium]OSI71561.1 UDP-glucosyltransferase [Bradyrhizobium canariense]OSI80524.1 UDP-glucosyltransferase [Bradyrhizobium canariense]OSI91126.1 UDP-glucosyltransferase [Bradyrhizobium canariense]OSI96737.1 UDP-glucosyltransferase [Bradyrhizobium canariense]OSJ12972.1 UDP-glucosyltransferase [Bradyrhizobium canariense]